MHHIDVTSFSCVDALFLSPRKQTNIPKEELGRWENYMSVAPLLQQPLAQLCSKRWSGEGWRYEKLL